MVEKDDLPERISTRVSTKIRQRIEELAAADDRPVSAVARRLLRQALAETDDGGELAA
jgi:predicted transcriptional regulator